MTQTHNWALLLWGAPAAGKSTLAHRFLELCYRQGLRVGHLGTDRMSEMAFGTGYDEEIRPGVYRTLLAMAQELLAVGRPLVLEGTFLRPEHRAELERICEQNRTRLFPVCVECSLPARLLRNRRRPPEQRVREVWLTDAHERAAQAARQWEGLRINTYQDSLERCLQQVWERVRVVSDPSLSAPACVISPGGNRDAG